MAIHVDPPLSDDDLRTEIFGGHLVLLTKLQAVDDLVSYTRASLTSLFAPYDPEDAHRHFTPAELSRLVSRWKPRFIHDEVSQELVRTVIRQAGLPATFTHYDLPKPRTSFPQGHLTSGAAFGFPWHRDLWYSVPAQQINWWMPVFPLREDNAMGFDLESFDRSVDNDSDRFDYYENNVARAMPAAPGREVQVRPGAHDHRARHELVLLPPPGAVLLFSGAHLHRTIPNQSGRSRFSLDFRTVDARDLLAGRGAPIVDARCSGTAVRDFRNVEDGRAFDEAMVVARFGDPPPGALLVFDPRDLVAPVSS